MSGGVRQTVPDGQEPTEVSERSRCFQWPTTARFPSATAKIPASVPRPAGASEKSTKSSDSSLPDAAIAGEPSSADQRIPVGTSGSMSGRRRGR